MKGTGQRPPSGSERITCLITSHHIQTPGLGAHPLIPRLVRFPGKRTLHGSCSLLVCAVAASPLAGISHPVHVLSTDSWMART
jgi:hypothetical protein